jgi:hypothetical protein
MKTLTAAQQQPNTFKYTQYKIEWSVPVLGSDENTRKLQMNSATKISKSQPVRMRNNGWRVGGQGDQPTQF